MLSPREKDRVMNALLLVSLTMGDPAVMLRTAMGTSLGPQLNSGPPIFLVRASIEMCLADGYNHQPPALIGLLELITEIEPEAAAIMIRVQNNVPLAHAAHDPFQDSVLAWKAPFLGRNLARSSLAALLGNRPVRPIVVVNGPSKRGKSYTADFISHVARLTPSIMECQVRVSDGQGASIGPAELARELVSIMGGDTRAQPQKDTNIHRWHQELVIWVTDAGMSLRGPTWWIVLDGFNDKELRSDTRAFIAQLARRLTMGMPSTYFRLILLDYDRTSLPIPPGQIALETTDGISHAVVNDFVTNLLVGTGIAVSPIANEILKGFPDPVVELPMLAHRLTDLIETAEAGA